MYHKELVNDLKKIFDIKKVVFSSVEYGSEQDTLYCDITDEKNRPSNGFYYFCVRGTIGFNSQYGNTRKGFFHYKWLASAYKHKARFQLGNREVNVNFSQMDKYFCKSRIDFVYRIKIEFNPSQKTRGWIQNIIKMFKKG